MIVTGSGIVAGFGFRTGASLASLQAALALAQHGQPRATALAAPQDKARALESLATTLGLPIIAIAPNALVAVATITHSDASFAARDTGSVAEASALAGAGPGARLLSARQISPDRMATCALATGIAE